MKFFKKVQNKSEKLIILSGGLVALSSAITAIVNLIQNDYQSALFNAMTMCFYALLSASVAKEMSHKKEIEKLKNEQ